MISIFIPAVWGLVGVVDTASRRSVPVSVCVVCCLSSVRCRAGRQGGGESRKGRQAGRGASAASSASSVRASLSDPGLPPVSLLVAVCELPGILTAKISEHRFGVSFLCHVHVGSGSGKPGRPVFSGWRSAERFSEVGSQCPLGSRGGAFALRTLERKGPLVGRFWLI